MKLTETTYSLWGYLVTHNDEFVNPLYDRETQSQILTLNLSPQNIKFWRGLYCRFETGAHPREPIVDLLTITQVCKWQAVVYTNVNASRSIYIVVMYYIYTYDAS